MSKVVDKFEAVFHRRLLEEVTEELWHEARSALVVALQRRDAELGRAAQKAELQDLRIVELERDLLELRDTSAQLTREAERRDLQLCEFERELLELRPRNAELAREVETAKRRLDEVRARNAEREAEEAERDRRLDELLRGRRTAEIAQMELDTDDFWAGLRKAGAKITEERRRQLAASLLEFRKR